MKNTYALFWFLILFAGAHNCSQAQTTVVFTDNFDRTTFVDGGNYGVPSAVYNVTLGSTSTLTTANVGGSNYVANFNSGSAANRAVYVAPLGGYASPFNPILAANPGVLTWTFNMRMSNAATTTTPLNGNIAGGMDLCGDAGNNIYNGSPTGYAVVFNSSSTGGVALVKFSAGLNANTVLITQTTTIAKTNYLSVKVTYDPATNIWSLYSRDDGTSGFTDPTTGTLGLQGTATDATYTSQTMTNFGAVYTWTAGTGKSMTLDNYSVAVTVVACSGVPTGTVVSTATTGCGFYAPTLSVTGVFGSGYTYQWQKSFDNLSWTSVPGATNSTHMAGVYTSVYYRVLITCTNSGLIDTTAGLLLALSLPASVATLPFNESFESGWLSRCDVADQPNNFWVNALVTGNRSFRREDDAGSTNTGSWGSPGNGAYTPTASVGSHSARYHSYQAAVGATGALYLFINLGVAGTKQITYDYLNTSGTDAIICQLSTDGGTTFSTIDIPPAVATSWTTRTVTTTATTSFAIIRFVTTSDQGLTDIGLDNVNVIQVCAVPVISGPSVTCIGTPATLTSAPGGGTWSSGTTSVATINPTSGAITSLTTGTSVITSNNGVGCVSTITLTVNPAVSAITGTTNVCPTATITLGDPDGGGTWASSNTGLATVGSNTGTVTGVAAGTLSISYIVSPGCISTRTITVNSLPSAAVITGTLTVCAGGATTALSDATTGGTWSSTVTSVATVGTGGVVTGVSAGTTLISYTTTNVCGNFAATATVTVNPLPVTPAGITGTQTVCAGGATTLLADVTAGGVWSSTNTTAATVNTSGTVTGVTTGTTTISYTITNGCGSAAATAAVTVNPLPVTPAAIAGILTVCEGGGTTTLSNTIPGGTWTSTSMATATVNTTGMVTGVTNGTTTISYTETNSCGSNAVTAVVTVNPLPSLTGLSAAANVCFDGASASTASFFYGGLTGGANQYTLTWSPGGPDDIGIFTALPGSTGSIDVTVPAGTPANTYTGTLTVKNSVTGCVATSTISLSVNGLPALTGLPVSQQVCFNAVSAQTASFGYTGITSSGDEYRLVWSPGGVLTDVSAFTALPGSPNGTITVNVPMGTPVGTYTGTLEVRNSVTNCIGVSTITIVVNDLPTVTGLTTSQAFCFDNSSAHMASFDYTGITNGADQYTLTWSPVSAIPDVSAFTALPGSPGGTITANVPGGTAAGTYTGTLTIKNAATSCMTTAGIAIVVNPLPSFTNQPVVSQTLCFNPSSAQTASFKDSASVNSPDQYTLTWLPGGILNDITDFTALPSGSPDTIIDVNVPSGSAVNTYTGTFTIKNSVTGCVNAQSPLTLIINPLPDAGTITGPSAVCASGGVITLSDAAPGGVWSSTATGIATVTPTGGVTGVSAGTATISYTVTNSCGTIAATQAITVNPLPLVPVPITGTTTICSGTTKLLSDATPGGTWSSTDFAVATVDPAGLVSGTGVGTATISYIIATTCGTTSTSTAVNVISGPAAITGTKKVCVGYTTTLSNDSTGGTWSSGSISIATVDPVSGVVSGVAATGTPTITYTAATGCFVTAPVTVNPVPEAITGPTAVCGGGGSITLNDIVTGGTWSSSDAGIANVSAGGPGIGIITGISFGGPIITYTLATGCFAIAPIIVNPVPYPILGVTNVCMGTPMSLSSVLPGGTWVSDDMAIATVDFSSGEVAGTTPGTANIIYTLPTGCEALVNVVFQDAPPAISGATDVCAGSAIILTNAVTGGTWSSSDISVAKVIDGGAGMGVVTGISGGMPTISYTTSTGCSATSIINVNALPAMPDPIVGTTTMCESGATTLSDATPGGVWSSSNPAVASVFPVSTVVGLSSGVTTISYTVTNGCGSTSITSGLTVNPLPAAPAAITGPTSICNGSSVTLTDATFGGTWASDDITVATISTSGLVSGLAVGTAIVRYTMINGCGSTAATTIVTVNPLPVAGIISGAAAACNGTTIILTDPMPGGVWVSSNMAVATVGSTGEVTGTGAGLASISYIVINGCGTATASAMVTINPLPATPASITGTAEVCPGNGATLHDATPGGTWSSSDMGIATVNGAGLVTGVAAGTAVITYTSTNGCGSAIRVRTFTVNPLPVAGAITGVPAVCQGSITYLHDLPAGGSWLSSDNSVVVVTSMGIVTGVSSGVATISYIAENSCGSSSAATITVTVHQLPASGAITGNNKVCMGDTIRLSNIVSGGTWSSSNTGIASVNASGVVTGVFTGIDSIIYTYTNSCGTVNTAVEISVVLPGECDLNTNIILKKSLTDLNVFPNPNNGSFTVMLSSDADEPMNVVITNSVGQKVKEFTGTTNKPAEMRFYNAAGIYFVSLTTGSGRYVTKVTVQ